MSKDRIVAYAISDIVTEGSTPTNLDVIDKNNLFYLRFNTVLQTFGSINRNRRIYNGESMMNALRAEHIMELQRNNQWLGEAGHPTGSDVSRISTILPTLTSHRMVSHTVDREKCTAVIETMDNGVAGNTMTKMILQGVRPAFSLRAIAPLTKKPDGTSLVQGKVHIVTYDWVILPSHKEAYQDLSKPIDKVVKSIFESGNQIIAGDNASPILESAIAEFLTENNDDIKSISDMFGFSKRDIQLTKQNVILSEGSDKVVVRMNNKMKSDITKFMRNL